MELSGKQKTFPQFFSSFLKSSLNFERFWKKMTLIADVFPKLRTCKNMVRSMPKKSPLIGSIVKQHGKHAKTLFKFERQHLYHSYWSLWRQLTCTVSLLVICKISRLFPNTLNANGKYSLLNRGKFNATNSDGIISKTKNLVSIFSLLFEI